MVSKNIGKRILLIGTFLLPLFFLPGDGDFFALGKILLIRIIILIPFFFFLTTKNFFFKSINKYVVLLIILCVIVIEVSVLFSIDIWTSSFASFQHIYPYLFYLLILLFIGDMKFVRSWIQIIIWSSFFVSLYGFLQVFHLDPISWDATHGRVFSSLGNPDGLASFLLFPVGMLLGISLKPAAETKKIERYLLPLFFILNVTCLFLTYSRGAYIAMAVQFLFWLYFLKEQIKKRIFSIAWLFLLIALIVALVAAILAPAAFFSLKDRILAIGDLTDPSILARLYLWEKALEIFLKHPLFGVGPGNFSYAYLGVRQDAPDFLLTRLDFPGSSHNEFLDIASMLGLCGIILYLLFWGRFFLSAISLLHKEQENDKYYFTLSFLLAGIGICVNFVFIFSTSVISFLIWGIWGGMELLKRGFNKNLYLFSQWGIMGHIVRVGIGGAIIWVLLYYHVINPFLAGYHELIAREHNVQNRLEESIKESTIALNYNSLKGDVWQLRGGSFEGIGIKLMAEKWFELAMNDYRTAQNVNPANPRFYADMGRSCSIAARLFKSSNWSHCMEEGYAKALFRDPYNSIFWHDYGISLRGNAESSKAELAFKQCLILTPAYSPCSIALVDLYLEKGFFKKAKNIYKHAIQLNSNDPVLLNFSKRNRLNE